MEAEALIQQLIGEAGLRPAGTEVEVRREAPLNLDGRRDVLVLDTACGQGRWTTKVSASEVDYAERRESGWAASVSVILSLYGQDGQGEQQHRHDETGSGRVDGQPCESTALALAEQRSVESARRRLAKRYANALDRGVLENIERTIRSRRP